MNNDSDTSNPDKEKEDGKAKPKPDKPIKTGNPDFDEVFKDTKSSNGDKFNYEYPSTKEQLEEALRDIPNAEQKSVGQDRTSTTLNDGWKVDTYPKRSSSFENDPELGWQIKNPNTGKQEYKGSTNP